MKPFLLISFFMLIILLFVPVKIRVLFKYGTDKNALKIQLTILKIIKIPLLLNREESDIFKIKKNLNKFLSYLNTFKKLRVKWIYFNLQGTYGLGDPAYTAITYGLIWNILSIIISSFQIKNPLVNISPNCEQKVFELYFESIFCLIPGNIMLTGIFILKEEIFNGRTKY